MCPRVQAKVSEGKTFLQPRWMSERCFRRLTWPQCMTSQKEHSYYIRDIKGRFWELYSMAKWRNCNWRLHKTKRKFSQFVFCVRSSHSACSWWWYVMKWVLKQSIILVNADVGHTKSSILFWILILHRVNSAKNCERLHSLYTVNRSFTVVRKYIVCLNKRVFFKSNVLTWFPQKLLGLWKQ